jgi:transcription initiation factor TFIID subunit 7
MSDSELIEREVALNPVTPGPPGSEAGDAVTPGVDLGEAEGEGEGEDEDEGDGDIDEELAAELDLALGDADEAHDDERDDDDDDDDDDESEEDDEDDDDESAQSRKLLNEEIRDLEVAIMKKENEIASSANPLIKVRVIDLFVTENSIERYVAPIRGSLKETQSRLGYETFAKGRNEGTTTFEERRNVVRRS